MPSPSAPTVARPGTSAAVIRAGARVRAVPIQRVVASLIRRNASGGRRLPGPRLAIGATSCRAYPRFGNSSTASRASTWSRSTPSSIGVANSPLRLRLPRDIWGRAGAKSASFVRLRSNTGLDRVCARTGKDSCRVSYREVHEMSPRDEGSGVAFTGRRAGRRTLRRSVQ